MEMRMVPSTAHEMDPRAEIVGMLEVLRDVLLRIDEGEIHPTAVDFAALADKVQDCIERVEALPNPEPALDGGEGAPEYRP